MDKSAENDGTLVLALVADGKTYHVRADAVREIVSVEQDGDMICVRGENLPVSPMGNRGQGLHLYAIIESHPSPFAWTFDKLDVAFECTDLRAAPRDPREPRLPLVSVAEPLARAA